MAVKWFVCEECGIQFQRQAVGRPGRTFCSRTCERQWWKANRNEARESKSRPICHCQHCGRVFIPKETNRTTFCSRECSYAHMRHKRLERQAELKAGVGESCRVWFGECIECGRVFTKRRQNRTICSTECQLVRNRKAFREHKEAIGRNAGRVESRDCVHCGKTFEQVVYNQVRDYCSKRCARKHWEQLNPEIAAQMKIRQQHVRRARKRSVVFENINLREMYERDGWKCGICGKKVNPELKFPHMMSASLDHIKPLAAGGTHTKSNVQLAHFICNSRKGAAEGGQLGLAAE